MDGALALVHGVKTSRARDSQAALQFDGRRKAERPGNGSNYNWGFARGGMTPTGAKEEGSVWRRKEQKKPRKPDKASEEQYEGRLRKRRTTDARFVGTVHIAGIL